MAAPALAKPAARLAAANPGRRRSGGGPAVWLIAALIALPLLLAAPFVAVQAGQPAGCADAGGHWQGPGSLGGAHGTGLDRRELAALQRSHRGRRLAGRAAGRQLATVYAPALGGINVWGDGSHTAGGIRVDAGRRRAYVLAVDPALIPLGTLVYVWPNPYRWPGPFVAADTGGAIEGRHVDIYVFGDRATATETVDRWGARTVRIAGRPLAPGGPPPAGELADCQPAPAGSGRWSLAPGANRPGVGLTPAMRAFMDRLASHLPREVVVCSATNHSRLTLTGNVSDHWSGNAVDICSSRNGFPASGGGYGDRIAIAAFRAAGYPPGRAAAAGRAGGAVTTTHAGLRVQIIWKSGVGGNHWDHIHVGIAPL